MLLDWFTFDWYYWRLVWMHYVVWLLCFDFCLLGLVAFSWFCFMFVCVVLRYFSFFDLGLIVLLCYSCLILGLVWMWLITCVFFSWLLWVVCLELVFWLFDLRFAVCLVVDSYLIYGRELSLFAYLIVLSCCLMCFAFLLFVIFNDRIG